MPLVEFEDVASYWALRESDAVADATGDDADLVGSDEETSELGLDIQDTVLRHDEEVSVRGVEGGTFIHVPACGEDVVSHSCLHGRIAGTGHEVQRMHPVYGLVDVEGIPSQLVWYVIDLLMRL